MRRSSSCSDGDGSIPNSSTSVSRVLPVDVERLGLAARPVEGEHQLAAETLAQRMVPDERLELRQHGGVAAERELRLEALLERGEPQLLEPRDRRLRERLVGEVGERCAAPEPERTTEQVGGALRIAALERLGRVVRPALEAVEVEPLRARRAGRSRAMRVSIASAPRAFRSSETWRCTWVTAVTGGAPA